MQPKQITKALHRRRIEHSARRLHEMATMGAPDIILCHEIALLVSKATLVYGQTVWAEIGKIMADPVRGHYEVCRQCLESVKGAEYCPTCQAAIDVEVEELEARKAEEDNHDDQ